MSERASRPLRRLACAAALCPLANLACSDDATIVEVAPPAPVLPAPPDEGSGPAAPEPGPTEPGPTEPSPVYALQTYVFTPDDSVLSYVTLTHSLDVTELPRDAAREFAGYAFITVVDGKLLVSDGESPVVTRYEITDGLEWRELDAVSFANQGVTGGRAGFERHWFQSPDTAYVTLDVTKRVI